MSAEHAVQASTNHAAATGADASQSLKLIRKLRWIGLDEEAGRLEQALSILEPDQRGTVVAEPRITD
jgi:hypothetical protein